MAGVIISGDTSGSVTLQAPATAGTVTVTLPATSGTMLTTASSTGISGSAISSGTVPEAYGGTGTSTGYYGFKNRIINGAMTIDQRNAGAAYTTATSVFAYCLDRFRMYYSATSKYTVQQNAGSVTPPVGFSNYLGVTSSAATTLTSSDLFLIQHFIEANNTADFALGTANAVTFTLSFWVRSSLTGTFGGVVNNASSYSYPFTYSIPSANTWTFISIPITGPTAGAWNTSGTSASFQINWQLQTGSTFLGTAGAWTASSLFGATGATNILSTNGATWYITGVQLEKGSTATSFDYRPYGTELALCQRYYQKFSATAGGQVFGSGVMNTTTTARMFIPFLVPLRTNPTALEQSGTASDYAIFYGGTVTTCSAVPGFVSASVNGGNFEATIASGGTVGYGTLLRSATSSAYLGWSAEL
jgi:hypothetical protein